MFGSLLVILLGYSGNSAEIIRFVTKRNFERISAFCDRKTEKMQKNMPPDATLDSTLRLVTVMVVTVAANIAVGSSTAGINGRRLFKAVCASST